MRHQVALGEGVEKDALDLDRYALDLDQVAHVPPEDVEHVLERGWPAVGRQRPQLGRGGFGDRARNARGPLKRRIMDDDGHAVGAGADVELQAVRSQPHGQHEGRQRVLGGVSRRAAMRDDLGAMRKGHARIEPSGGASRFTSP